MPYSNPQAQARAQHDWYIRNRTRLLAEQAERRATIPGYRDGEYARNRKNRMPEVVNGRSGKLVEHAHPRGAGRMLTAQETDAAIAALAEANGRNKVTTRFVDPATLRPAKESATLEKAPSTVSHANYAKARATSEERAISNERRRQVVEYLDERPGVSRRRSEIADATGLAPSVLTPMLASLVKHELVKASGSTTSRRYWRGESVLAPMLAATASIEPVLEHPEPAPETEETPKTVQFMGPLPAPAIPLTIEIKMTIHSTHDVLDQVTAIIYQLAALDVAGAS